MCQCEGSCWTQIKKIFSNNEKMQTPPPKKNKQKTKNKKTTGLFSPWIYRLWYMLLKRNQNVLIYTIKTFLTVNFCLDRPCYARKRYFCQLLLVVYFYYISYTVLIFIHIRGHLHLKGIQNTYSVIVQRELLKEVDVSAFPSEIRKKPISNIQKTLKLLSNYAEWQNSQGP